jgi:ClpP class serine protease
MQGPSTRKRLYQQLEQEIGRPIISFFTSLTRQSMLEDTDADLLEGILQNMDLSKGFALFLSSYGGYGEAAERIVNVCRNASGTGEFWAIVPGKAKSAATMVCFGSSKIWMGASSELGPIDPQLTIIEDGRRKSFSVWNIVRSYEDLFKRAVREQGNLEPYIQQLQKYDYREIQEFQSAILLSEDIAVRSLKSGMMRRKAERTIKSQIKIFLTPQRTKSHGRPIYRDEAKGCGLVIEPMETSTKIGQLVYELHLRLNTVVSSTAYKCIESREASFVSPFEDR